jgi:hypothetical protein
MNDAHLHLSGKPPMLEHFLDLVQSQDSYLKQWSKNTATFYLLLLQFCIFNMYTGEGYKENGWRHA